MCTKVAAFVLLHSVPLSLHHSESVSPQSHCACACLLDLPRVRSAYAKSSQSSKNTRQLVAKEEALLLRSQGCYIVGTAIKTCSISGSDEGQKGRGQRETNGGPSAKLFDSVGQTPVKNWNTTKQTCLAVNKHSMTNNKYLPTGVQKA